MTNSSIPTDGNDSGRLPADVVEHDPEGPAYQKFIASLNYLGSKDIERVRAAYRFAEEAHRKQKRLSGEPYITHPLAVASALAEWRIDAPGIVAALLHDVMEDTTVGKARIVELFGKQVADLVDGLSKLEKIESRSYQEAQAENFNKMLMAMVDDPRVVLIKLVDRRHNLQTMDAIRPEKRRRIARETLEIYAPIANHMGLGDFCRQLQDLSFAHIHPWRFKVLSKALGTARGSRGELVGRILGDIRDKLAEARIEADVSGREKSLYSIYRKMVDKHLGFSRVFDIYGFRVIVGNVDDCYLALGTLHSHFRPIPNTFKDYIAIPKTNGYRSLHTTLTGPYGTPIEIQIRTQAMHHQAEQGIASHWLYKDSEESSADMREKTHIWLQSLLDLKNTTGTPSEFLESVKADLFLDEEVYVFTPVGQILALPRGATVIDFAYAVHTDIGHHCVAAYIDHDLAPLFAELKNGNQVEIITAPYANPNPVWLDYVKTSRARNRIRQFLRGIHQDSASALGEKMLEQELQALGVAPADVPAAMWERVVHETGSKTRQDLYSNVGMGRSPAAVMARRLTERRGLPSQPPETTSPLLIRGTEGMAIQLSSCCQPIPGDPIIGLLHKDQGLRIHTHACPTVRRSRDTGPQEWIRVEWESESEPEQFFEVRIKVTAENVVGMLGRVASGIAEFGVKIDQVSMIRKKPGRFTNVHFQVLVHGRSHLASLMRHLRHVRDVVRIMREQGSSFEGTFK
ncbi:MAG: bifunctional (p)ppGpp synthetase/guanosine-3',5'-bis(diphosphate) 3'-pyrophosphohydrolase [Candidatus Accumulibacter sp.]|jgi:GTP pyrophosphokinase/guanosine-3',5'-bis(diphosphate) 3'-pyrophosphohydrolase|nr:bifunctional (p)ppGpp synthetase/guanosine-3',5'-bis(diphosphate) 3'-pyrophosphohydrolase [Accumulibacter sp.]